MVPPPGLGLAVCVYRALLLLVIVPGWMYASALSDPMRFALLAMTHPLAGRGPANVPGPVATPPRRQRLLEVDPRQTRGVANRAAHRLVREELQHVCFSTNVHGRVFQNIGLAYELGVREMVHGVGGDQPLLDRDQPVTAHEVLEGPALLHDVLAQIAAHLVP